MAALFDLTATSHSAPQEALRLYAARIVQYAETWQGGNYKGLAWFICQQSSNKLSPPFSTLIAQTLYHDGFRTERNNLDFEDDRIPTLQNQSDLTADRIRVVYLRGLLTPECILDIGSRLSINPEYFRRHLNFLQLSKRNHFDLPTSQSSARHFPCFKIITICIRQQPIRLSELRDARKQEREAVKRYQRDLAINITPGEPIIRRYSVLNANLIAVEQNVSVAFTRGKEGECYMIVWFDNGRTSYESKLQRLLSGHDELKVDMPNVCIPVVEHNRYEIPDVDDINTLNHATDSKTSIWQQSADALITNYGSGLDQRLMKEDAKYALSELVAFCHSSEVQFLNAVEACIDEAIQGSRGNEEQSLESLAYSKRLLDEHIAHVHTTIQFIDGTGNPKWPTAKDEADAIVVDKVLASLSSDYTDTLQRAKYIATRALEGTDMLINGSMLKESKKGIAQAESTKRLSLLAAFFLPLNLVTSFFGMNFRQFGQGPLHIWIAFACMGIMLLVASILVALSLEMAKAGRRKKRRRS